MNLWRKSANQQQAARLKHDFVIGPQRHNELFGRPARLYYCVRCKWSFMVGGSNVVVLDEDGSPLIGEESLRRFSTLAEGPCPVLEAFVSATVAASNALRPPVRGKRDETVNPVPSHTPAWSYRPRPLLHALSRVRQELGR
jgi:hypothetical protein